MQPFFTHRTICGWKSDPTRRAGRARSSIEVTYNGLCGTDATEYTKGPMMVPLTTPHPGSGHVGPTILGHEFIGMVVEAGPGRRGVDADAASPAGRAFRAGRAPGAGAAGRTCAPVTTRSG